MQRPLSLAVALLLVLITVARPATAQFDDFRALQQQYDPQPFHPEFSDPISADSPNAAGRYLWLKEQVDRKETYNAGIIVLDLTAWHLPPDYYEDDFEDRPDIEQWRTWLRDHEAWTQGVVEASRLERFTTHHHRTARNPQLRDNDPRRGLNSALRMFVRVLRDDAVRLWIEGEREAALDRAEAIVRIGLHLLGDDARMIESIVAGSILQLGFDLIEHFGAMDLTDQERDRLISVCVQAPTDDPIKVRSAWARQYSLQRDFVSEQLEIEGGGDALWIQMGMILGIETAFSRMFQPAIDALDSDTADTAEEKSLPKNWPDVKLSIAEAMQEAEGRFEDLTHDDLVEAFERSCEFGDRLLQEWDDEYSDYLFEDADEFVDHDPTMIGSLVVGPVSRLRDRGPKVLNARNAAIAALCGADPAP